MHRPVAVPGGPTDWNEALDMISFGSHDQVDVIAWSLLIIINNLHHNLWDNNFCISHPH